MVTMSLRPPAIVVLLATLAATGCPAPGGSTASRPVVIPSVPTGDYFPLAEGMQWKYEVVTLGANVQGLMTLTVTKLTKAGAETTAEGVRTLALKLSDGSTHGSAAKVTWTKDRDGAWEAIEDEGDARQVLKLPLRYGDSWTFGGQTLTLTAAEDVAINGKTYKNALKLRGEEGDRLGSLYLAKDVGVVSWWGRQLPKVSGDQPIGFGLLEHVKKGATPPSPPTSTTPAPTQSPAASPVPSASPDPSASASPAAPVAPSPSPVPSTTTPSAVPTQVIFS